MFWWTILSDARVLDSPARVLPSLNPCSGGLYSLTKSHKSKSRCWRKVLILVLVDYTLWPDETADTPADEIVLILVLVDYTLWRWDPRITTFNCIRLNPCSGGLYSLTRGRNLLWWEPKWVLILVLVDYTLWQIETARFILDIDGLNPCSGGLYSLTLFECEFDNQRFTAMLPLGTMLTEGAAIVVLILVLVDYTLWRFRQARCLRSELPVLILVLVDYTLWPSGYLLSVSLQRVLILVLVDYTLWPRATARATGSRCLNPCSGGLYSLTKRNTWS